MSLRPVTKQEEWDGFVSALPRAQFTQSWAWGEFRQAYDHEVTRLMGRGSAAMFYKVPAPVVGGYWYAPRGPVGESLEAIKIFLDLIMREQALPGRALFWRVEPPVEQALFPHRFVQSHAYMPATTRLIDLTQSEEVLQKAMHEKTRYNIRVAERKGVTVRSSIDDVDVETFLHLTKETATRDAFRSQPLHYIRATIHALIPFGMVRIRLAEKDHAPLAASVEVVYGDTVTYLYGASSSSERNAMAPYALHWGAMLEAKRSGRRFYDLYGVNPTDTSSPYYKQSWEGISRFKRGWGGEEINYTGTWELPRSMIGYRLLRLFSR